MTEARIANILKEFQSGKLSIDEAVQEIAAFQSGDMGFAHVDLERCRRRGTSEVIYGASKTPEQIVKIAQMMIAHGQLPVLVTRLAPEAAEVLRHGIDRRYEIHYDDVSRIAVIGDLPTPNGHGVVAVVTAGTSDMAVAEEAVRTLEFMGNAVERIYDVGVAGIHRLFEKLDQLRSAQVIIAIAGMEGALASVVAGLTDVPVIAVPTSVGYGAAFGGLTALLAMINSCAAGISVVNIDNGFGAAYIASKINHLEIKS